MKKRIGWFFIPQQPSQKRNVINTIVGYYFFFKKKADLLFHGATAPTGLEPPHYQGFTTTLRHTTLGTMVEITSTLTTFNSCSTILEPFPPRVNKSHAAGHPGELNFVIWRLILSAYLLQFFPLHTKAYQFTCTEQKATDKNKLQRSLQTCGSSAWNWLYVTLL